jgi:phage protein U
MFAILGDIPFQIVGSPESLSDSRGYDYAEHRVIQSRPRLQWLADDLETIQLEMLLHRSFTAPAANLLVLQQAAETHAALPLVFGNGDFRGYFVITRIETVSRQMSGSGDLFAITVRLELCESPVQFDPVAPPIPSFLPIAIVSAGLPNQSRVFNGVALGLSALSRPAPPSGPAVASLTPADVPPSSIVRSA